MGGSPQKYVSIVGSEINILKANGGVKEKGMCLKDKYMGGGAVGAGGLAPPSFCQICTKSPFLPQILAFLCLQPPHIPVSPASLSNSLRRLCNKSVRAVALSYMGFYAEQISVSVTSAGPIAWSWK